MDISIGDIFKSLVWDNAVKYLIQNVLFKALPFLSWGPIGFLVSWFITWLTNELYVFLELQIDLQVIAWKNVALEREFKNAELKLKLIARDKGLDSEEFKSARKESVDALYNFVSLKPKSA